MNTRWNPICLFRSLSLFTSAPLFPCFSDNKWSVIPLPLSLLSLHFIHHSVVPQSLILLFLPPPSHVFQSVQSSSSSSQSHPPLSSIHLSLWSPQLFDGLSAIQFSVFFSIFFFFSVFYFPNLAQICSFSCEKSFHLSLWTKEEDILFLIRIYATSSFF